MEQRKSELTVSRKENICLHGIGIDDGNIVGLSAIRLNDVLFRRVHHHRVRGVGFGIIILVDSQHTELAGWRGSVGHCVAHFCGHGGEQMGCGVTRKLEASTAMRIGSKGTGE